MSHGDKHKFTGLWAAVLLQAFYDLKPRMVTIKPPRYLPSLTQEANAKRRRTILQKRRELRRRIKNDRLSAQFWIESSTTRVASFLWICDHLELDAEFLREMAKTPEGVLKVIKGSARIG